jgi:hypothetical protein
MKRFMATMCMGMALVPMVVSQVNACNPRPCRPTQVIPVRPAPVIPQAPVNPQPGPEANGPTEPIGSNEVVWDLPETEKRRIREAVLSRTAPMQSVSTTPAPTTEAPALPERITRALAAHKALAAQVNRLMAKRTEIQRWDNVAQEKFRQAFGSTDEQLRQRVLQRIDQLIQEGSRQLTTLADEIRFEFYVARNKR